MQNITIFFYFVEVLSVMFNENIFILLKNVGILSSMNFFSFVLYSYLFDCFGIHILIDT